jgi:hypothetical protein
MKCTNCGYPNNRGESVCVHCLKPLEGAFVDPNASQTSHWSHSQPQPAQQFNNNQFNNSNNQFPIQMNHPGFEGERFATGALVCGLVGLVFFGFIFGIIALVMAKKAKKLGVSNGKTTAATILGWINIIGGIIFGIIVIAAIIFMIQDPTLLY